MTMKHDEIWSERAALPAAFYQGSATEVAPALLGKVLVTRLGGEMTVGEIVEVEAYLGSDDEASHSYRGITDRNRIMFSKGGVCYVYLSYGMHYCMNVVTGAEGMGEAVLIRAIAPLHNLTAMAKRRGLSMGSSARASINLSNGPGKLCQAFGITKKQYGWSFDRPDYKIVDQTADDIQQVSKPAILSSPRIGISKAKDLPLRFYLADSQFVSKSDFRKNAP